MKLLDDKQLEAIMEVTRKGNPVQGSVLFKLCVDIKTLRRSIDELSKVIDSKSNLLSHGAKLRKISKAFNEIKDIL